MAVNYVKETLLQERKDVSCSINNPPIGLNHPYDSNNRLAKAKIGYEGRDVVLKQLSVETARDCGGWSSWSWDNLTGNKEEFFAEIEFPFLMAGLNVPGMKNGRYLEVFLHLLSFQLKIRN